MEMKLWRFKDAPVEYQQLSPHGGDEEWVALVPVNDDRVLTRSEYTMKVDEVSDLLSIHGDDVEEVELPGIGFLLISAHA